MTAKVSVIIPTYNKCHELRLLIYSLERQSFNPSQMEIIVVDDASTDLTYRQFLSYHPSYRFRYLRNVERKGRSYTRNRGIEASRASIFIFLDAEMIVEQDFVRNHVKHHDKSPNKVVTGAMHLKGTYTVYHSKFSNHTRKLLRSLLKQDANLYNRCKPLIRIANKKNTSFPMMGRRDIALGKHRNLSFDRPYFPEILDKFGPNLQSYKLPWTSFLSGNVSLRRELIDQAGGYDERFIGWGFEDWEIGYRLYRCGASFIADSKVTCYHQEHPSSEQMNKEMYTNYHYYQQKHPYFETSLHAMFLLNKINRLQEHMLVEEYQRLERQHSGKFMNFKNMLMVMFNKISVLLMNGISPPEILNLLKYDPDLQQDSLARQERDLLAQQGSFKALVDLFDQLLI